MRFSGRFLYKLLPLLLAVGITLLIIMHYFANTLKDDEFLMHLPPVPEEDTLQLARTAGKELKLQQLLDWNTFNYTIPNDICRSHDKELLAILIVTSYAGHDELRAAHRQAITQSKLAEMGFQRVFLIAEIPPKEHFITQAQLASEHKLFGDLLQGNFQEAYRNLSYKHVMGLRWAATECARAKFIIKLDDDIVYDVFQLRRYLDALELERTTLATSTGLLAGYILDKEQPKRNKVNKWYVTHKEYAPETYPPFLSGWLYITNQATALRLVLEAQRIPYFWIDDIWLTGLIRTRLNIPMQRLNAWFSANAEFLDCCVRDLKQFNFECEYFVGPNGGDTKLLVEFMHNVEKCYFDECVKRPPEKSLKLTCVASVKHFVPDHGIAQIEAIKLR